MKKAHNHLVLSDKECAHKTCKKHLKLRLVEAKAPHNIVRCFKHGNAHKRAIEAIKDRELRERERRNK